MQAAAPITWTACSYGDSPILLQVVLKGVISPRVNSSRVPAGPAPPSPRMIPHIPEKVVTVLIKSEVQMSCDYVIRRFGWNSAARNIPLPRPSFAATHLLPVVMTLQAQHVAERIRDLSRPRL